MQDFKECLDDLEQQVADFTDEVQQLAQYTSESISFEVGACDPSSPCKQPPRGPPEQSSCCPHVPNHLCKAEQPACACLLQELIGHCSAVYSVNRAAALALEQHLLQYGYQQPADAVLAPESLQECMQEDTDSKRLCDSLPWHQARCCRHRREAACACADCAAAPLPSTVLQSSLQVSSPSSLHAPVRPAQPPPHR